MNPSRRLARHDTPYTNPRLAPREEEDDDDDDDDDEEEQDEDIALGVVYQEEEEEREPALSADAASSALLLEEVFGERRRALSASELHDRVLETDEDDEHNDGPVFRKATPMVAMGGAASSAANNEWDLGGGGGGGRSWQPRPAPPPPTATAAAPSFFSFHFNPSATPPAGSSTPSSAGAALRRQGGSIPKSSSETNLADLRDSNLTPPTRSSSSSQVAADITNGPPSSSSRRRPASDGKDGVAKSLKAQAMKELQRASSGTTNSNSTANSKRSTAFSRGAALRQKILQQANNENQGLNPVNKLYKPIFRKDFLVKHVKRLETSVKVLTTQFAGDLFVGSKQTCEAITQDLDLMHFGGRRWGGGNGGVGEGLVKLDFVEIEALRSDGTSSSSAGLTAAAGVSQFKPKRGVGEKLFWEEHVSCWKRTQQVLMRRGKKSLSLWVGYWAMVLVLLTATFATGLVAEDMIMWDGLPAWRYFFFAFLFLAMPMLAYLLHIALMKVIRMWVARAKEFKAPDELQDFLNLLYVFEKLRWDMTLMITFLLYTVCFLVIFAQHPARNQPWSDAYKYTTSTFGALCIYFLGRVLTQAATQAITRNVDVKALGAKVRKVLRREQALWEILQVTPSEEEENMFSRMEDPFVLVDPRMADHLARGLIRTQFAGRYTKIKGGTVDISIDSQAKAGLLGSWVYQSLMRRSTTSTRGTGGLRRTDSGAAGGSRKRAGGSGDSNRTRAGGAGEDESSVHTVTTPMAPLTPHELRQRSSFMSLLSEAKARHGGASVASAQTVYPELDLCMPFNHRLMILFGDAIDRPASKLGTVRGCPKRNITINDVALCLERPEETLQHVWNEFFDSEHQGKVDLRRVRDATISLVSDRINLKATLESNAKVKGRLSSVISALANFVVLLVSLAIFGLNVSELWLSMSSVVLAFSFIFGGTLKNIFDSVVFLFGVHPYDIGDKIKLGVDETPYWIDEIALMSTRMLRWDGSSVEFLNSYLYTAVNLVNVNRSGNHSITLQIRVDAASVPSKREMDKIRTELEEFLSRSSAFTGECTVTCREFIFPLIVRMTVWFEFAYNDINAGRTYSDTSKVIIFLIGAFKKRNLRCSGVNSGAVDLNVGSVKLAMDNGYGRGGGAGDLRAKI